MSEAITEKSKPQQPASKAARYSIYLCIDASAEYAIAQEWMKKNRKDVSPKALIRQVSLSKLNPDFEVYLLIRDEARTPLRGNRSDDQGRSIPVNKSPADVASEVIVKGPLSVAAFWSDVQAGPDDYGIAISGELNRAKFMELAGKLVSPCIFKCQVGQTDIAHISFE